MTELKIKITAFFALALAITIVGCVGSSGKNASNYRTIAQEPAQDSEAARKLSDKGLDLIQKGKLPEAETVLKTALEADIDYGPAHNNLGSVYFQEEKLYLAAWEFQYAAKLMPDSAQPLNNLGLVFEAVNKHDEAIEWFDKALKAQPDGPEFLANDAAARYRRGDRDEALRELLNKVSLRDERSQWRNWARRLLEVDWITPSTSKP